MKLSRIVCVTLLGAGLFLGSAGTASASTTTAADAATTAENSGCLPGIPATAPETAGFYQGEPAFGPTELPTGPPVDPLLFGYERFGDLTEAEFLATYRAAGAYLFPAADGFLIENGVPVKYAQELRPGTRIDRFGFPGGSFLAPVDTPFAERSLPPQNLTTPAGTPQSNYHVYCVLRPFTVSAGPIAPWFGQPGLGIQYKLDLAYLPEAGTNLSVTWLLANGYLVEEKPAHHHLLALGVGTQPGAGPWPGPGDGPSILDQDAADLANDLAADLVGDESVADRAWEELLDGAGRAATGPLDGYAGDAGEPVDIDGPVVRVPTGFRR